MKFKLIQLNSSCLLVAMEMVLLNIQSPEKVLETHSTMSSSSHWCDKQIHWGPKFQIPELVIVWTYSYSKSISRKKKHPAYEWRMEGGFYTFYLKGSTWAMLFDYGYATTNKLSGYIN